MRTEYQEVLMDIADQCSEMDVFHAPITKSIIDYVNQKYGMNWNFFGKRFQIMQYGVEVIIKNGMRLL